MDKEKIKSIQFKLPLDTLPDRLDKVLAKLMPEQSRARLQDWIESGHVTVDGEMAKIRSRVGPGASIKVQPQPAPEDQAFTAEPIDFKVLAETPNWIVIDKPYGLVTHPGAGNWHGTLLNGLLYRFPELAMVARAGIVHRLDKDTSGILIVARTPESQTNLVRQLQARSVVRKYRAIVHGHMQSNGFMDQAIGRDRHVPVRMTALNPIAPKAAKTNYYVESTGYYEDAPVSSIICQLETGRTHQIRVHLSHAQYPLVGDVIYGGKMLGTVKRQMLHAYELGFVDPADGQNKLFNADLPSDFQAVLAAIKS